MTGAIIPPALNENTARDVAEAFLSGKIAVEIMIMHIILKAQNAPVANVNIAQSVIFVEKIEPARHNALKIVNITKIF